MAKNITLLGASYSNCPAILLPQSGGGTARFDDASVTTATASDVASGKVFLASDGTITTGTNSGGGASNIVRGTFTTGSTGGSVGTFTIPYTGSGYPIALMVVVKGGAFNNSSTGNTTWYNSVNRYDAGVFYMTKSRIPNPPSYTSGADDYGVTAVIYKNSTSTSTTYTRTSSMTSITYNTSNASTSNNCVRFKGNGTTVSYYVGNRTSSTVGLARDTEFEYIAIYSE